MDNFEGNLTSTKWAKMCNCSQDTASNDIKDLINKKILKKIGDGRNTHYALKNNLDELVELAFDDQCTGANPAYPLMSDIKQIYIDGYYGNV